MCGWLFFLSYMPLAFVAGVGWVSVGSNCELQCDASRAIQQSNHKQLHAFVLKYYFLSTHQGENECLLILQHRGMCWVLLQVGRDGNGCIS
jgi:hypothetical protein